ncbi:hypothetical protein [Dechloromonas sp. A34]|uniref:hypothetical protein n=1 Tax=Dechloromonas sp. A34 TaxID=447588 RepID=UPI0022491828|nr:hypothetical protein [Dechloromonas sp. A34]
MQHWILDDSAVPPPTWQQALLQAWRLERWRAGEVPADQPGILWCRLHAGETPAEILRGLRLSEGSAWFCCATSRTRRRSSMLWPPVPPVAATAMPHLKSCTRWRWWSTTAGCGSAKRC